MNKVRKKKPPGTPGVSFPESHANTTSSLSGHNESVLSEIEEELHENDDDLSVMPKGGHVYEENIKIDMLVTKTNEPVHLRNQAIMVLARFFVGDKTRRIIPFFTRHQQTYPSLHLTDALPHNQDDLTVYLTNPTVSDDTKAKSQVRLTFFVRMQSQQHNFNNFRQANGNFSWLQSNNIYIRLMELETTDNERIGMIIGKAPRITSLSDFKASLRVQIHNRNKDQRYQTATPPFQLSFDNIGKDADKTRTRVITITCSKTDAKLLTTIFQTNFPSDTNHPFLSYSVFYSLTAECRNSILQQHHQRTAGRTMLDVTIPDFHLLSKVLKVGTDNISLRSAIGNIRQLDGTLLHIDIDDATRNGDTIMIVAPQNAARAQQVVGDWILQHHKQQIDWTTSSNFPSSTHRLDFTSRTSAAGFASAFPPLIITTTKPSESSRTARTQKPSIPTPKKKKPPSNSTAWKSLTYSNTATTAHSTTSDTTPTEKTAASSSASHLTSFDDIDTQLYILRDRDTTLKYKLALVEARSTLRELHFSQSELNTIAVVDDMYFRLARLEMAGDRQNKINQKLILSLAVANDADRQVALHEVGQRIDAKIRTRKTEKQNRPQEEAEIRRKMELPPDATLLGDRARIHVRKLKACMDKHDSAIRDNDDTSSDSSISTLGLSEFDENGFIRSESDDDDSMDTSDTPSPSSTRPASKYHQEIDASGQSSDIIMDIVSVLESSIPQSLPTTPPSTSDTPSSLQKAAANIPEITRVDSPPSTDSMVWEIPPPEFFQEWKDTEPTKSKAPSRPKNQRGPPGRLSPPTINPTIPTNNRYAILEDLPLQRPSIEQHQRTSTGQLHNSPTDISTTNALVVSTSPAPHTSYLPSRDSGTDTTLTSHTSTASQYPTMPRTNPSNAAASSILSFFAAKHAKRGSPRRKKRTQPSSPSRNDMPSTRPSDPDCPLLPASDTVSPLITHSTASHRLPPHIFADSAGSDDDPESQSTHMHSSPTASDHHDSQANALTTAMLHITHQDDSSETSTVIDSDTDMDLHNSDLSHQNNANCSSPSSPPSPSVSIQYNSPNAGHEGNEG
jgi:hypothetical protein